MERKRERSEGGGASGEGGGTQRVGEPMGAFGGLVVVSGFERLARNGAGGGTKYQVKGGGGVEPVLQVKPGAA